jgi:hypothetical protein
MMSEIGTLMVDCLASSYLSRLHPNKAHLEESADEKRAEVEAHEGHIHVHAHATHGHSHGSGDSSGSSPSQLILHRVITQKIVSLLLQRRGSNLTTFRGDDMNALGTVIVLFSLFKDILKFCRFWS